MTGKRMAKRRKKINLDERDLPASARRIRELREYEGLSQAGVAEHLMVSQRAYAEYELGNVRVPVEILISLAKFYDVDMNYICGLTEEKGSFPKQL